MIWFFVVPMAIVWVVGIVDVIRRPLPGRTKAIWLAVVVLLPFIGTIIYFGMRVPSNQEVALRREAAQDLQRAPTDRGMGPPPPPID